MLTLLERTTNLNRDLKSKSLAGDPKPWIQALTHPPGPIHLSLLSLPVLSHTTQSGINCPTCVPQISSWLKVPTGVLVLSQLSDSQSTDGP